MSKKFIPTQPKPTHASKRSRLGSIAAEAERLAAAAAPRAPSAPMAKGKQAKGSSSSSGGPKEPYDFGTRLKDDREKSNTPEGFEAFVACGNQRKKARDFRWTFSLDYIEAQEAGGQPRQRFHLGITVYDKQFQDRLKDPSPAGLRDAQREAAGVHARYYGCTSVRYAVPPAVRLN